MAISAGVDLNDVALLIIYGCDLDWLELLLNVAVQRALSDHLRSKLFFKLINIEIHLEQAGVRRADDVAELLKAVVGDVGAALDRQVSQLRVLVQLSRELHQPIVREQILVQHNGPEIGVRAKVEREHAQAVVMDARPCEVHRPNVVVSDQLEGGLNQALWLLLEVEARVVFWVVLDQG